MGSKGKQQSTESPSQATEAPAEAASATPEQDTLGNAAVAERVGKAPKADESSSLLDGEGNFDFDHFYRETQIRGLSPGFFCDGAFQVDQIRMLNAASQSQAADLLAGISTHAAKRLFRRVAPDQRLKVALASPRLVGALDLDLTVEFMFSGKTQALAKYLTLPQINALTNAESDAHPKLARLMVDVYAHHHNEALDTMPYMDSVLYLLELERVSKSAVYDAMMMLNLDLVHGHLDAAMRYYPGAEFDALVALFESGGRSLDVELWYLKREGK